MKHSAEGEVLRWFERALDQPSEDRLAWLERQSLPAWLYARVRRLIQAESRLDRTFLEQVPVLPDEGTLLPKPGERVGAYELLRQIDAGGMGVVFLARRADSAYEQRVAVKLIRPLHVQASSGYRQQLIARFENERMLLARLDHRNIARIVDGGTLASGVPYIVMEYVEGQSLIEFCNSRNADVRERLTLFRKVCAGVQEAHRHLIVHRDLKPDNILVDAEGEPRLLDFGIARTLEAEQQRVEDPNLTSLTVMTPAYASPEQVRREPLTTSSDVYSLGVVLYQMLAGARPYDLSKATPAEAQRLVCETNPAPMRTMLARVSLPEAQRKARRSELTPELDRIVARAMHKDAARRYASAKELGDDIDRYLRGQPVLAHPDSPLYRMRKFVGRHRVPSAITALLLIGVLVASGVAVRQWSVARQAAADTEQVNAFLLDVLSMSDPFDVGSELTLSQALDEAAELIDERFANRPDLTAQIRFGIGYSMLSRYRLAEAEQQLLRAEAESEAQFGASDIRTLRVKEGVAGLRHEQGRIDEAIALYEKAIADAERYGFQGDSLYVDLLGNLGNLYLTIERYEDAQRWLQKASAASTRNQEDVSSLDRANVISNLAHAAHGLQNLDEAERLYAQAQSAYEALFPDGNPDLASVLNNRALLAEDRNQPAQALELHKQSLAVRQKLFDAEHPMIVTALANVARMATAQGDKALGLSRALEAVAMADRVYTEPHPRHASAYATLAGARVANGDVEGAVAAWRKGQSILATVEEATPSVVRYLERVRAEICKAPGGVSLCETGA